MKHAVLVTAHDNMPVVRKMLTMLDDERFTFYLLIDKKSKREPSEFIPPLARARACVLPRMNINWASYSQIEAELRLIEAALSGGADYLHFTQGADLPLKSPDEIDEFCGSGELFMDVEPQPSDFANYKVLCKHYFAGCKSFRKSKFLKALNHGLARLQKPFIKRKKGYNQLYAGSALWSIPADFARFVIDNRKAIYEQYKRSLAADEVFIHTLCMHSDFRARVSAHGGARLIDWANKEGNSPKTFTIADKEAIDRGIKDPHILFARKFNWARDREIVEYIFEKRK